ncbi:MAG: sensor histidine kinase [Candidatus Nitrosocosmicus sp.]
MISYFNGINEKSISQSLLVQREQRQEISVKSAANNINSDLKLVESTLKGLSDSKYMQNGLFSNNINTQILNESYHQINSIIDNLFLLDQNGIIIQHMVPNGENRFIGSNLAANANWVIETMKYHNPVISGYYIGLDGKLRFGITNPIINRETGNLIGMVGAIVPVEKFFSKYGNIYDINSEFISAYDSKGSILVTPRAVFIGKNVFSQQVQQFANHDPIFNRIINNILNGQPDSGTYFIKGIEYLNTGYPVFHNNKTIFSIAIVTPTSTILSSINKQLITQSFEIFLILAIITCAIIILLILIYNWQRDLQRAVAKRTSDLAESNNRLEIMNEKLITSERVKEEFISMISHELRTPLTPIKGFSQMLLEPQYMGGASLNKKQEKAVTSIISNVSLLERLIEDVLDTYKIDLNRLKINKINTSIEQLIKRNLINFVYLAHEKGIVIEADIKTKKSTRVHCDVNRIDQVFGNLINNSIDFVPSKNGKITLRAEYSEESNFKDVNDTKYVTFTVEDNGYGIPHDKIDSLFKKFYQIDTSITRKHGGTGLGLVICKGIIEAHGGRIWFDKNYTKGAAVKFTLPIVEEATNTPTSIA